MPRTGALSRLADASQMVARAPRSRPSATSRRLPLSVSIDRLGLTAMRCADLLAAFADTGDDVDRSGTTGRLVEVYPAAALRTWRVDVTGYKTDAAARITATASLLTAASWLTLSPAQRALMEASDDALDAVVAALVARAHALRATHPVPPARAAQARREGWIALPATPSPTSNRRERALRPPGDDRSRRLGGEPRYAAPTLPSSPRHPPRMSHRGSTVSL